MGRPPEERDVLERLLQLRHELHQRRRVGAAQAREQPQEVRALLAAGGHHVALDRLHDELARPGWMCDTPWRQTTLYRLVPL
jgi:hypothetical protein